MLTMWWLHQIYSSKNWANSDNYTYTDVNGCIQMNKSTFWPLVINVQCDDQPWVHKLNGILY